MTKRVLLSIFLICSGTFIFFGLMQQFQPKSTAEPGVLVEKGLAIPVGSAIMFFTFIFISVIFLRIQKALPDNRLRSGILFSVSLIGFWFIAMFEPYFIYNESLSLCLFLAVVDSISLLILGILLGLFVRKSGIEKSGTGEYSFLKILIVGLSFLSGRLFSYFVIGINSGMLSVPVYNLVWIICLGLSTGFFYIITAAAMHDSPSRMSLWFGFTYYGPIWFIYNSINLIFTRHELGGIGNASLLDLYLKTGIDILFVICGVFIAEAFIVRLKKR